MSKKDYPLSLVRDISKLIKEFQKLAFENEDIIEKVEDKKYLILLRDREHPTFYFSVFNPNQANNYTSYFEFEFLPQSDVKLTQVSYNNDLPTVLKHFSIWINLLREYDAIELNQEDYITKQYEEEFFHEFEIVDEDAYTKPFEHEKQVFLYNLLTHVEIELNKKMGNGEDSNTEVQEIINETITLKENIQNLSKKNAIRKLSKIYAKIKKHGIKLFQDILNEAKKEIIKRTLSGGMNEIGDWIHHSF